VTEVDISGPCTRQTMVYVPAFFARNVKLVVGSVKRPEFRNAATGRVSVECPSPGQLSHPPSR